MRNEISCRQCSAPGSVLLTSWADGLDDPAPCCVAVIICTRGEFLSAVQPAFAVISAGFENSYGHPHPTVVERLREHHAAILRTDLDGMITIRTDGRRMNVETYSGLLGHR